MLITEFEAATLDGFERLDGANPQENHERHNLILYLLYNRYPFHSLDIP